MTGTRFTRRALMCGAAATLMPRGLSAQPAASLPARGELLTPDGFGAYHKAEIEKWWPVVRAAGLKAE